MSRAVLAFAEAISGKAAVTVAARTPGSELDRNILAVTVVRAVLEAFGCNCLPDNDNDDNPQRIAQCPLHRWGTK